MPFPYFSQRKAAQAAVCCKASIFWHPVGVAVAMIGSTVGATLLVLKVLGAL